MNRCTVASGLLAAGLALWGALSAHAQVVVDDPAKTEAIETFSATQLEQMVAPIALYPDSLLSQVLMASTYPLEIVQAGRFIASNAGLKGTELEAKLKEQEWEPAVKSLCTVPDVLTQMSENLDWTQDLGDAFLSQRAELMDAVQRMRGKAYEAGNLKSSEQQTVTQKPDQIIVIESPSPQVVYVPTYSPTVVYGPAWTYPAPYYPAFYAPPPYGYGMVAFGTGVAVGAAMYGGCSWGWGSSEVDIDINENHNFNRSTDASFDRTAAQNRAQERAAGRGEGQGAGRGEGGTSKWNHDPSHRKGVNYRDSKTASQFGAREGQSRVSRDQARGFDRSQRGDGSVGERGGRDRGSRDVGSRGGERGGNRVSSSQRGGRSEGAFSGSRNTGLDRSASSRGHSSRASSRSGGGGSRGGGRRGGGGGGRRR
jgi:hypothetical protein